MRRKRSSEEWMCVQQGHAQESREVAAEVEERLWQSELKGEAAK
jgi:hypothetical protein